MQTLLEKTQPLNSYSVHSGDHSAPLAYTLGVAFQLLALLFKWIKWKGLYMTTPTTTWDHTHLEGRTVRSLERVSCQAVQQCLVEKLAKQKARWNRKFFIETTNPHLVEVPVRANNSNVGGVSFMASNQLHRKLLHMITFSHTVQ